MKFTHNTNVSKIVVLGMALTSGAYCVSSGVSLNDVDYTCVDKLWMQSCKINSGYLFSGARYTQSITGKPCVEGEIPHTIHA